MRALGVLAFLTALSVAPRSPSPSLRLGAWLTYWDLDRGLARLATPAASKVDDVFFFSAALAPDGGAVLLNDFDSMRALVSELQGRGTRVWLTVVNDVHPEGADARPVLKDATVVHRILSDPAVAEKHRREILALVRRLGVSGVDIDYENLEVLDRDRFTSFIGSLSEALEGEGALLSVTAQPKVEESRATGPGALDWRALCTRVDRLQIMLYNQHSGKTGPGPVATGEWITSVLRFAGSECAPSRIVPVLKVSGMEWSKAGTRGVQYDECIELARKAEVAVVRDEPDRVPYFSYVSTEGHATVYFEDALSIEAKVKLIERLGFEGVVLWSLGREDPEILPRIAS
ncbi:MAG TPA: glycosyl hydrolase family 18 protein [Vicinamibacteria bacterium]